MNEAGYQMKQPTRNCATRRHCFIGPLKRNSSRVELGILLAAQEHPGIPGYLRNTINQYIVVCPPIVNVLSERYLRREVDIPWVFWHRYRPRKADGIIVAPFQDRKKFMRTLCAKAKVPYFRFHPLRHAGASLMEAANIPITSIQDIFGHESRKTTEIYLHSTSEFTKNNADV